MIIKFKRSIDLKKGFTLVEMLVVISLIGILAALALVSFSSSQKQARDTERKSDLRQYQTALENYASKNTGLYPSYTTASDADAGLCTILAIGTCPSDPKDTSPYVYRYISNGTGSGSITGTTYSFWTGLESKTTTTYWVVCSSGKIGESTTQPTAGTICPI